jgi:hypothetical protein
MRRLQDLAHFIALYRGRTVAEAELIAVSAESSLVQKFFRELTSELEHQPKDTCGERPARVLEAVRDE